MEYRIQNTEYRIGSLMLQPSLSPNPKLRRTSQPQETSAAGSQPAESRLQAPKPACPPKSRGEGDEGGRIRLLSL